MIWIEAQFVDGNWGCHVYYEFEDDSPTIQDTADHTNELIDTCVGANPSELAVVFDDEWRYDENLWCYVGYPSVGSSFTFWTDVNLEDDKDVVDIILGNGVEAWEQYSPR